MGPRHDYEGGTLLPTSGCDHRSINNAINGFIHADVKGAYDKFFEGKPWSSACQKFASSIDLEDFKTRLSMVESPSALCILLQDVLELDGSVAYRPLQTPPETGGIALFSAIKELERLEVVGVFRREDSDYKHGLFNLYRHALTLFTERPDRLFVHGFYIFGSIMECWVFDRSGIYSCETINIAENPERLLTTMAGYAFMSESDWGRSDFIKEDSDGIYVEMSGTKMYLEAPPFRIKEEETIVRGSLVCHRGRESPTEPWRFVVNYKWIPPWHRPEAELLQMAQNNNVWGVVQLHGNEVIDRTESLRSGLIFGQPQQFKAVDQTAESNEMSAAIIGAKAQLETFHENRPNLPTNPGYRNVVLNCWIVSPLGTSIFEYFDVHQLLEVFSDAIKAHRSLYDSGILHRNISTSSIIIPPPTTSENSPKGIIINLDVAWDTSRGLTPQGYIVGTAPFMAIGALEAHVPNNARTYRYNLESFFYVFLFIAICPRENDGSKAKELPETSRLLQWRQDNQEQMRKIADMGEEGFKAILEEFSPEFESLKELAKVLRGILFPLKDGKIWTDMSLEEPNKLYDDMTRAFQDALSRY